LEENNKLGRVNIMSIENPVKLNLGCGYRKKEDFVNIDYNPKCDPDVQLDIVSFGLNMWEDNSVDEVRAWDFLEHVPLGKTIFVIEEIFRVLRHDGKFEHFTPSTDGRGAFQDPTHLSFWNINSWIYYTDDEHRKLYGIKAKFKGFREDLVTDKANKIIHTHGVFFAVKESK